VVPAALQTVPAHDPLFQPIDRERGSEIDTISILDIVADMPRTNAPLPRAAVHILLALGPGPRHGYAIMTEVLAMTDGSMRLAPGTLYTNIKRLLASGLIEEVDVGAEPSRDERRRYYRLSPAGHLVVSSEVARMEALVDAAQPWLRGLEQ
jgi:DNA-binding PadR family transcriptional regulator